MIVTQVTRCDRDVTEMWHLSQLQVTQSHNIKKDIEDSETDNII